MATGLKKILETNLKNYEDYHIMHRSVCRSVRKSAFSYLAIDNHMTCLWVDKHQIRVTSTYNYGTNMKLILPCPTATSNSCLVISMNSFLMTVTAVSWITPSDTRHTDSKSSKWGLAATEITSWKIKGLREFFWNSDLDNCQV